MQRQAIKLEDQLSEEKNKLDELKRKVLINNEITPEKILDDTLLQHQSNIDNILKKPSTFPPNSNDSLKLIFKLMRYVILKCFAD